MSATVRGTSVIALVGASAKRTARAERWSKLPAQAVVDRRLSPLDVRVLAAIAIHVNDKHRAWPSQEWVAQLVGVRRETANRAIGRLADLGYLRTERVSRYGGYWRNEYEVLYPAFAPPPHPQVHGTGDLRRTFRVRHRREST